MWKKALIWLVLLCAALSAYLFSNGLGSGLVLIAVFLLPLLGFTVRRLFPPRQSAVRSQRRFVLDEDGDREESVQVRDYVPGDDVRRIHWKLSEKLDRTLIRELIEEETQPGLRQAVVPVPAQPRTPRLLTAALALGLYAALCGSLCDMASLSALGLLPLIPGGAVVLALALLPKGRTFRLTLALLAGAAALFLALNRQTCLEAGKVLLNRLYAASEAAEIYIYEKFDLEAGPEILWAALLPLGVLLGGFCGGAAHLRRSWPLLPPVMALLGAVAYLGVSPRWGWCLVLAMTLAPLVLAVEDRLSLSAVGAVVGVLAALSAAAVLYFPRELPALTAWEEQARDALAVQTVAWSPDWREYQQQAEPEVTPEAEFYQEEDTGGDMGGDELDWTRPLPGLLVILLFALALFIPALINDRAKKCRAANRSWMDDPDCAAAVRAGFLYAMRWMRLGGLPPENKLFSDYGAAVEARFSPAMGERYRSVLPLWQEAAYSAHEMTEEQRSAMIGFAEQTRQTVWDGLSRRKRFLVRYIYAL